RPGPRDPLGQRPPAVVRATGPGRAERPDRLPEEPADPDLTAGPFRARSCVAGRTWRSPDAGTGVCPSCPEGGRTVTLGPSSTSAGSASAPATTTETPSTPTSGKGRRTCLEDS